MHSTSPVSPLDSWTVFDNGLHNAFTDLVVWRDMFWLAFVSSPSHFASRRSRIVLMCSSNARNWEQVSRLDGGGEDIRDPKLAVIHDRLTIYALLNRSFDPQPYRTVHFDSADGESWSSFTVVGPAGWLLGKPKTVDGRTWFAPAHHLQKGAAQLLCSINGLDWQPVSTLRDGGGADESAIDFLPDGHLQAVTRIEAGGLSGSRRAGTLLSVAEPPYTRWTQVYSKVSRLDGPTLFSFAGKCYAVGRSQPYTGDWLNGQGSIFARKRTSLYRLDGAGLTWLADLPSTGDTAYAGTAILNGKVIISYYTNNPRRDLPWIIGMFSPTMVRVVSVPIEYFSC
ncbi:MAG: hypothetical protein C3F13_16035 [Anaerolineales bacterium]|nr:MAG: hypothetical protein C3F13_16035 [Anaerolineales bacterium]